MGTGPEALAAKVQVNIPFAFLFTKNYLSRFLEGGLNPEIGLDAYSLTHYPPRTFRRIASTFQGARRRLTLHGPFQDLAPGALDDGVLAASRRRLRQAFRYVAIFRPVAIVCHLGYEAHHYQWDHEAWLARTAATFRELALAAAAQGALLTLENVYETEAELFLQVMERIGAPNVRVCLDVGHLAAFGGGNFPAWLKTLAPVIGQLHLHDNHGDDDTHQALGTGIVPLEYLLNFLADRGCEPLVTLEPHEEETLLASLEHLARIWPWK